MDMMLIKCMLVWQTTKGWAVERAKAAHEDERGLVIAPWTILLGIVVIAVIAIGTLIITHVTSQANKIVTHIDGQP